ncbi:hypothetical protein GCM10022407_15050 [Hymenobacter antarcticus]|uniref:Uncharacterized protein n=1 Tax=Hymenobacter antarcticus TaxID=486270 RepID=A0ABP7PRU5_9BACT
MVAAGIASQGAFLEHQIAKIERHAFFAQYPIDDGKGGIGQIYAGLKRGLVTAQTIGFLLHQLPGFLAQHEVQAGHVEGSGHIAVRAWGKGLGGQRPGQGQQQQ